MNYTSQCTLVNESLISLPFSLPKSHPISLPISLHISLHIYHFPVYLSSPSQPPFSDSISLPVSRPISHPTYRPITLHILPSPSPYSSPSHSPYRTHLPPHILLVSLSPYIISRISQHSLPCCYVELTLIEHN